MNAVILILWALFWLTAFYCLRLVFAGGWRRWLGCGVLAELVYLTWRGDAFGSAILCGVASAVFLWAYCNWQARRAQQV